MFISDDHPSFRDQPADDEAIWRYMDLARYLSLLQASALHFATAAQMRDRWEGAFGPTNIAIRPTVYGEDYESMLKSGAWSRTLLHQRVRFNCWHLSEVESAAMWDIYQREGRGVAVRSTWGRLKRSIQSERHVYGAKVKYVDYNSTFIPEGFIFDALLHKRESFAHEREVRLMMMTGLSGWDPNEQGAAIDLGPESPVLPVVVDLHELVDAVYVAPEAPDWVGDVVEAVTRRYDCSFPFRKSDLATDPIA